MAIDRTGISSLDAGASDITYSGDEGPKSPDQQLMASADPMLVEEYRRNRENWIIWWWTSWCSW